jgi:murein L,D-transpeptidase YafK
VFRTHVRNIIHSVGSSLHRQFAHERTIDDRAREYDEVVRKRIQPDFQRANIPYPPLAITLIAFKREKILEVYATGKDGGFQFIRSYPILAASGRLGPKLREGDQQVPEGLYRVESLNPNSHYHLALRVNYPNEFDHSKAANDNREHLGGDIMIHGSAASIGCLAMGDSAAEDLFVLVALTGIKNVRIILSPIDFRFDNSLPISSESPSWLEGLYIQIKAELQRYPRPDHTPEVVRQ